MADQSAVGPGAPVGQWRFCVAPMMDCTDRHARYLMRLLSLHARLYTEMVHANAVVHGCRKDPSQKVQVWVGCDQQRGMIIVVQDPGEGFDPNRVPSPLQAQRLYAEHGRGIYLINQLMDEVHFEEGGTEIWMIKR